MAGDRIARWLLLIAAATASGSAAVQEAPPKPPAPVVPVAPAAPAPKSDAPPAVSPAEYMGRRIAAPMSFEGGPWLMRLTREKEESCAELLRALYLEEGQTVADVGCGNGFYTFRLAELVGAKGKVYALDIQPEMLAMLKEEGERRTANRGDPADPSSRGKGPKNIVNVIPIQSSATDPKLPEAAVDLAVLVDVYHEFAYPAEMLAALKKSLKPGGRIVLVEFRLEDPEVPIKLEHKMSKEQVNKELGANGYELAEEYDGLPWQHVMFFQPKPPAPAPEEK